MARRGENIRKRKDGRCARFDIAAFPPAILAFAYIFSPSCHFCFLLRLGHPSDHLFCSHAFSSGFFMRNWELCKKTFTFTKLFRRPCGIHLYNFLLNPRYNHDKIIREFKQRCRKIGILHFPCGGYFFVLLVTAFSYHYATAYLLYHKTISRYTQLRIRSCTNFCTIMLR